MSCFDHRHLRFAPWNQRRQYPLPSHWKPSFVSRCSFSYARHPVHPLFRGAWRLFPASRVQRRQRSVFRRVFPFLPHRPQP